MNICVVQLGGSLLAQSVESASAPQSSQSFKSAEGEWALRTIRNLSFVYIKNNLARERTALSILDIEAKQKGDLHFTVGK